MTKAVSTFAAVAVSFAIGCSSPEASSETSTSEAVGVCQANGSQSPNAASCCSGHSDLRGYCVPQKGTAVCSGEHFVEQCTKGLGGPPIASGQTVCDSTCGGPSTTLCLDQTASWACTQNPQTGWGYCAAPNPCTAGTPPLQSTTIATVRGVGSMVGDDNALYIASDGALLGLDLTTSGSSPSVLLPAAAGGFGLVASVLTSKWVGVTANQQTSGGNKTSVQEIDRAGAKAPNTFETIPWATLALATDGSFVYANSRANGGSVVTDNPAFSSSGGVMTSGLGAGAYALATDGSSVFFADYGDLEAGKTVIATASAGAAPKRLSALATGKSFVSQLLLSAAGLLVWNECYRTGTTAGSPQQCTIMSLAPRSAASPTSHFSAYNLSNLVTDSTSAYWVYDGSIYKVALDSTSSAVRFISNACGPTSDHPTSLVVNRTNVYWSCLGGSIQSRAKE